jgi:hypothetical protein
LYFRVALALDQKVLPKKGCGSKGGKGSTAAGLFGFTAPPPLIAILIIN